MNARRAERNEHRKVEVCPIVGHPRSMDASLLILKAAARRDSVEFPPFLANHLPMVLVALDRLGAAPDRLAAFAQTYRAANGLRPALASETPLTADGWTAALGQRAREAELRAFFSQDVARRGAKVAVATYLPLLAPGIAGSAFHPLMRLAYAVTAEDEEDIGIALGYWAATYLPLDAGTGFPGFATEPAEVLRRAARLPGLAEAEPESDLLWHNMRAVAKVPSFTGVADWLIIGDDTLDRMAAAALALFAGTMSFEALHAVTGCHWLRLLQPMVSEMPPLLRHFWVGIASLMPKMGFPECPSVGQLEAWRALSSPDWREIKAAAIASDDEHDHSLTFSAFEEWLRTGDNLYRIVAAKRVGLVA
jgi:hypothetical protein